NEQTSMFRTISIYDFPSIDEANERAFSSCLRPLIIMPPHVHPSTFSMHSLMIAASSPFPIVTQTPSTTTTTTTRRRGWPLGIYRHERRHLTALPLSVLLAHPEIRRGARRPILVTASPSAFFPFPLPPDQFRVCRIVRREAAATGSRADRHQRDEGKIGYDGFEDEDDERFRRLREAYFNSPDYDRSERPPTPLESIKKYEEEEEE
ncbi:hypothetical protein PMAYCL1PPCAC_32497, partial [Pristionchus mayeri]